MDEWRQEMEEVDRQHEEAKEQWVDRVVDRILEKVVEGPNVDTERLRLLLKSTHEHGYMYGWEVGRMKSEYFAMYRGKEKK